MEIFQDEQGEWSEETAQGSSMLLSILLASVAVVIVVFTLTVLGVAGYAYKLARGE